MKPSVLFMEGVRTAWAQKVPSVLTALVIAIMCFTALTTVGKAVANEHELAKNLETTGSRLLTVTDTGGLGIITSALLGVIQGIDGVGTAVALSSPNDVTNGKVEGSTKTTLWQVSDVAAVAKVTVGQFPQPGQAAVSTEIQNQLLLTQPAGFVRGRDQVQFPIVSGVTALPGFEDFNKGILVQATSETQYTQMRVVVKNVEELSIVQRAVVETMGSFDPTGVSIESPKALNTMAEMLQTQLEQYNQSLLALILGVGSIFISIVVLSDVLLHRRELGRRRALGVTRSVMSLLTIVRTVVPSVAGALLGCLTVLVIFKVQGINLPIAFAVATGWLAVMTAGAASALPAIWASTLDPVAVLRTP